MKFNEAVVGRTIESVEYLEHEAVVIGFTDGSYIVINQRSQTGTVHVSYIPSTEDVVRLVEPDNAEE